MRVLLSVHHQLDEGFGAPGVTLRLGRAYAELGHDVSYLSFEDLPSRLPALAKEALYPEFAALRLRSATRGDAVDVIDASTGDAWLWSRLQRFTGPRRPLLVTRSHGLEHRFWGQTVAEARRDGAHIQRRSKLYHGRFRLWEVARSLRDADLALLLNLADRDYAIDRLGVAVERAHVVPNGVPDSLLGRPLATLGQPARIAHIGSWSERKGIRYLVPALTAVLRNRPGTALSMLGARRPASEVLGAFPEDVRERIAVVSEYPQSELPALLAGHHVVVSASLAEGFSLALPEAMACGLVPVATAIPGTLELIDDTTGVLVPAADPEALGAAVGLLLDNPNRLDRLRIAAHARVQELSWRRIAADTLALYQRALATPDGVE